MPGLSVSDVVNVDVNMSPLAVPLRNFGSLCIAGPSAVIDVSERLREYTGIDDIGMDFGTTSPEYLAADLFFAQHPQPSMVYLGRFAQTPTSAVLHGAIMSTAQQAQTLAALTAVSNGTMVIMVDGTPRTAAASAAQLSSGAFATADQATLLSTLQGTASGAFSVTIDGTVVDLAPIDFTGVADLTAAAALIETGLGTKGTFIWNAILGIFQMHSATTGAASTITYASAPTTGTDISGTLKLTLATGALPPVNGASGMNFTNITNLNGAASIVSQSLSGAVVVWDGTRFNVTSLSSGPTSTIGYGGPAGTGQDVSTLLGLTKASGASVPVNGIAAETALQCAVALRAHPEWYGFKFAVSTPLADSDYLAVAAFIEAASPISIFGYTTQDTAALDPTVTTDLASAMKGNNFERTFGQYSSSSAYADAAIFGRAFTVDFEGSNTVITLKFKQEPGVTGELLTENQAATLKAKNINQFVYYNNDVAIIQEGVMSNGFFFDEVHGTDWQANRIQTDVFNALYTAPTKIPQTNPGVHILVTTVENAIAQGVTNGLIAPGQWNAPGFGQIVTGQMLPKGYYVYAPLVETQPQSIRETRTAPTIQAAIKLAGAIHKANVVVNVNR